MLAVVIFCISVTLSVKDVNANGVLRSDYIGVLPQPDYSRYFRHSDFNSVLRPDHIGVFPQPDYSRNFRRSDFNRVFRPDYNGVLSQLGYSRDLHYSDFNGVHPLYFNREPHAPGFSTGHIPHIHYGSGIGTEHLVRDLDNLVNRNAVIRAGERSDPNSRNFVGYGGISWGNGLTGTDWDHNKMYGTNSPLG